MEECNQGLIIIHIKEDCELNYEELTKKLFGSPSDSCIAINQHNNKRFISISFYSDKINIKKIKSLSLKYKTQCSILLYNDDNTFYYYKYIKGKIIQNEHNSINRLIVPSRYNYNIERYEDYFLYIDNLYKNTYSLENK